MSTTIVRVRWGRRLAGLTLAVLGLGLAGLMAQQGKDDKGTGLLKVTVLDDATGKPTPARVELLDEKGKAVIASDALLIGGD